MARKFTYKDVRDWKVVTRGGAELVRSDNGKPTRYDGYRAAAEVATRVGGVAVRV